MEGPEPPFAKAYRQTKDRSDNWARATARDIVAAYGVVALEDLKLTNMMASASGTVEAPGTNVAAKAALNRKLAEAALGRLRHRIWSKRKKLGAESVSCQPATHPAAAQPAGTWPKKTGTEHGSPAVSGAATPTMRTSMLPRTSPPSDRPARPHGTEPAGHRWSGRNPGCAGEKPTAGQRPPRRSPPEDLTRTWVGSLQGRKPKRTKTVHRPLRVS